MNTLDLTDSGVPAKQIIQTIEAWAKKCWDDRSDGDLRIRLRKEQLEDIRDEQQGYLFTWKEIFKRKILGMPDPYVPPVDMKCLHVYETAYYTIRIEIQE